MRTEIYVYKTTSINISTCEGNLQLCRMDAAPVSLSYGDNAPTIQPGIYKIVSSHEVHVSGDLSAFDFATSNTKENDPTPPPLRATEYFAPLDTSALQTFMTTPDAKVLASP
jgi:hypothetical protein